MIVEGFFIFQYLIRQITFFNIKFMMQDEKPRINWNDPNQQPNPQPQGNDPNDPDDIDVDKLPKRYAQFDTTAGKGSPAPIPQEQTRYVEFDEKAFMSQTGFIEDNEPFDVIELPSKGYFYPNKKANVRVGYLTAADENILTSPNLIQSGQVIDVLLRKKIKDRDVEVSKLLPGDRTAIMLFLRATGYGKDYTVILTDPGTGEEFEYIVDLSTLPTKELTEVPNESGEFAYMLPRSKAAVKLRILNPGDEKEINEIEEKRKIAYGAGYISSRLTMRLERAIVEINGNRDKTYIAEYIQKMPAFDSLNVRSFLAKIEPGIDTNIVVKAPSGEIIQTSVPFGPSFFWPKL
jgi:hypothetical protein